MQTELEEFGLDKGASFHPAEAAGRANLCKRAVLASMLGTVLFVRAAAALRLQRATPADATVKVLLAGQIATVLRRLAVGARRGGDAEAAEADRRQGEGRRRQAARRHADAAPRAPPAAAAAPRRGTRRRGVTRSVRRSTTPTSSERWTAFWTTRR